MAELNLTDQNFEEEVVKSDVPVLVDFWAPWCGPCKMQGPIIAKLAEEFKDKNLKIAKLNVDENQESAQKFGVMSIPTLIIFKDGEVADQMIGLQSIEALTEKLNSYLS